MNTKTINKRVRLNNKIDDLKKDSSGLNAKQKRFVSEYVVDLNGSRAARASGYSKKNARVIATENLAKPAIKKAVEEAQAKLAAKTEITAERVLQEIAKLAFADIPLKDLRPGDKLGALRDLGTHLNLFKQSVEIDTRTTLLNVSVSAADLEQARQLVENFRSSPPLIEGQVEDDEAK
jgi:phage terminase small subunit